MATGLLFAASLAITLEVIPLLIWWYVLALLVSITLYDLYHFIIPDVLSLALLGGAGALFTYRAVVGEALPALGIDVLAALAGSGFLFFLWYVSKGTWLGFGDVKLAFPLGLLVGAPYVFSLIVLAFWIGAVVSVLLLLMQTVLKRGQQHLRLPLGTLTMKSVVPFAPFLVAAVLVVLFTRINVLTLFSF
jgi:prepilin signal peptidase PulO-like enzyme (type II secretory pathway)